MTVSGREAPKWSRMAVWLADGLGQLDDGEWLEIGPAATPVDAEGYCDCAEIWRIGDRWLVRLSRVVLMDAPDDIDALPLDSWVPDHEGTDRRLASTDPELIAEAVVVWFRDRLGVESTTDLGFARFYAVDVD